MFELYLAFVPLEGQKLFLCQSMQEKLPVAGSLAYPKAYADIKLCEERKKMMKEKLQNIKEEALKLKPVLAQIEGKEVRKIIVIKGKVVNIVA